MNRRKGNRVVKRLRHDVKMLYKRVETLEGGKDAAWKKGYSKGCMDYAMHGGKASSSSSSIADVQPAPKGKGKGKSRPPPPGPPPQLGGKSSEPVPKGSVATGKPRQFSR